MINGKNTLEQDLLLACKGHYDVPGSPYIQKVLIEILRSVLEIHVASTITDSVIVHWLLSAFYRQSKPLSKPEILCAIIKAQAERPDGDNAYETAICLLAGEVRLMQFYDNCVALYPDLVAQKDPAVYQYVEKKIRLIGD